MGNPVTLIAELKDAVIEVNGHKHNLGLMLARAGSCPLIDVDVAEIEIDAEFAKPWDLSFKDMSPIVYKHAGKLLVIVGVDHVRKAVEKNQPKLKARLLTSVALKSARIIEPEPERTVTPPSAPFNPPRFSERRPYNSNRPSYNEDRPTYGKPSYPKKRFA